MLQVLFLKVLNMSLTASFVILLILAARFLFKKAPKKYVYSFWGIALFRLLCPFSFESIWSMIPSAEVLPTEPLTYANHNDWRIQTGFTAVDQAINPVLSETSPDIVISGVAIFAWIWLAGMAAIHLNCMKMRFLLKIFIKPSMLLSGLEVSTDGMIIRPLFPLRVPRPLWQQYIIRKKYRGSLLPHGRKVLFREFFFTIRIV